MKRYAIILQGVSFLREIDKINNWDKVTDETRLNANHTVPQSWTHDTQAFSSKVSMGKSGRLIISHVGSAGKDFIKDFLLAYWLESKSTK